MKRLLFIVLTPVWLLVLFAVVFRVTFPSNALIERAEWQVSQATDGAMALDIGGLRPAFFGLRGSDVVLSSVADGVGSPILAMESLRVSTGVMSLIGAAPAITGTANFGDGSLDFDALIGPDPDGVYDLRALDVETSSFPISALPPIQGTKILGTGGMDLTIDLEMPDGYANANGRAMLSASGIELSGVSGDMNALVTGFGILPATLDALDIEFDVREGTATVRRGTITSTLADVSVEGDIVLTNRLSNSRLRLDLVIDAKEPLQGVSGMMNNAKWSSDNKFHYEVRGTFNRPRFSPARERNARRQARQSRRDAEDDEDSDTTSRRPTRSVRDRAQAAGRSETIERARAARQQMAQRVPGITEIPDEPGIRQPTLIAPDEEEPGGAPDTAEPPPVEEEGE